MKRLAIVLGLVLAFAGCASQSSEPPADSQAENASTPTTSEQPQNVTDLSQISSAKTLTPPIQQSSSSPVPAAEAEHNPNAMVQKNIERLFVSNVDNLRYHEGRAPAPGQSTLLNDKAAQFSEFSYQLLNQTLTAARDIEPDRLGGRKLPLDLAPMLLVGTMDSQGRLTEISIESHSGDRQVDQIIIDACKKGLWSRNPPAQAIDSDGMYRVRVKGYIRAYTIDIKGSYKYDTEFALGIL